MKQDGPVLFVATAEAGDEEMQRRIQEHRRQRPSRWRTLEAPTNVGGQIVEHVGNSRTVVLDCITLLVSNIIGKYGEVNDETDIAPVEKQVEEESENLVKCIRSVKATFVIVSNEVGLGLVPANRLGRLYRDLLGRANQELAQNVDEVYLMVAGLPLKLKPQKE